MVRWGGKERRTTWTWATSLHVGLRFHFLTHSHRETGTYSFHRRGKIFSYSKLKRMTRFFPFKTGNQMNDRHTSCLMLESLPIVKEREKKEWGRGKEGEKRRKRKGKGKGKGCSLTQQQIKYVFFSLSPLSLSLVSFLLPKCGQILAGLSSINFFPVL